MNTLTLVFFFSSFFAYTALGAEKCPPSSCDASGRPLVQFPFEINGGQAGGCGYRGFSVSCNNRSQTVLNIPPAGEFVVKRINYASQSMYINDPDFCLPRKLISFNFQDSPFKGSYLKNFTLINCTLTEEPYYYYRSVPVTCLSGENYTVRAMDSDSLGGASIPLNCQNISIISVPFDDRLGYSMDLNKDIQLTWGEPRCGACVAKGGTCGFKNDKGEIGCSHVPRHGLPRSAKYGIIIGGGIPGVVCIIGVVCYMCSRVRAWGRRSQLNTQLPTSTITPQSAAAVVTGLDGPTIESYPKTVLGDSGRLPKPNDGPCPICLSEYQPKEVLRIIPECNHFFHADCVDEWLRMNATCPLCRNLPDGSALVTPCSSMSLSSSSTSSSS